MRRDLSSLLTETCIFVSMRTGSEHGWMCSSWRTKVQDRFMLHGAPQQNLLDLIQLCFHGVSRTHQNHPNIQSTNPTCETEENLQDKSSLRTSRHVFSCSVRNNGRPRTRCSSMTRYRGARVAFRNISKHSGSFTSKQN